MGKATLELSADEKRLVRLFRCLNEDEQSRALILVTKRLLKRYTLGRYRSCQCPAEEERREFSEAIFERLREVMPLQSRFVDLRDYDWYVERSWEEAGEDPAEILLGTSKYDEWAAETIVDSYLEGAGHFDVPLETDFCDQDYSVEDAEKDMRASLLEDAVRLIMAWRGQIVSRLEQRAAGETV